MARSLLSRIRLIILLVNALWLLTVACKSGAPIGNRDPAQRSTSKPANSPIMAGPITYVALGDSTGSGVGATEGGYVARLFKRLVAHRPDSKLINLCVSGSRTSDV